MAQSCELTLYSFKHVQVVLAGRPVIGLWEGEDAVQIAPHADVAVPMVGVDGSAILSITANQAVTITIRLQSNSPSHEWLQNMYRAMRTEGRARPFSIHIRDTGNGEGGVSAQAYITNSPGRGFGANATSRDWVIFAQCWEENKVSYVPA